MRIAALDDTMSGGWHAAAVSTPQEKGSLRMTTTNRLPAGVLRLLQEPNIAHVATVMPDGSPQVTPVWIDTDGTHILFNTAEGRQKTRNLRRSGRVAISITDRNTPTIYATIRGRVIEMTHEGAEGHISALAKKYTGREGFPVPAGQQRVIIKILPEKIAGQGID